MGYKLKRGYGLVYRSVMQDKTISREAKVVYALIQSYTGSKEICYPSHEKMAENLCCSTMSIIRWVDELEKKGLLLVHRKLGEVNKYEPLVPDGEDEEVTSELGVTQELLGSNPGVTGESRRSDPIINTNINTSSRKKYHYHITWDSEACLWDGPTEKDIALWRHNYPSIDLDHELGRAGEWLNNNPARASEIKNFGKFLANWFKDEQDKADGKPGRWSKWSK